MKRNLEDTRGDWPCGSWGESVCCFPCECRLFPSGAVEDGAARPRGFPVCPPRSPRSVCFLRALSPSDGFSSGGPGPRLRPGAARLDPPQVPVPPREHGPTFRDGGFQCRQVRSTPPCLSSPGASSGSPLPSPSLARDRDSASVPVRRQAQRLNWECLGRDGLTPLAALRKAPQHRGLWGTGSSMVRRRGGRRPWLPARP